MPTAAALRVAIGDKEGALFSGPSTTLPLGARTGTLYRPEHTNRPPGI